jgi:hypothetical protein
VDAAEAHRRLSEVTGGLPPRPSHLAGRPVEERLAEVGVVQPPTDELNSVAASLGAALDGLQRLVDPVNTFTVAVRELLEALDDLVDQDGREIWLTAGEVELDQWTQRLTDAAAVVRRQLGAGA